MSQDDIDKLQAIQILLEHEQDNPLVRRWLVAAVEPKQMDFPLLLQSFWLDCRTEQLGGGLVVRLQRFLDAYKGGAQECLVTKNRYGDIPLHLALKEDHTKQTISYLVKLCPRSLDLLDATGASCSHLAARYCTDLLVQQLILFHRPELAQIRDDKGLLPLHRCLLGGKKTLEVVGVLQCFPAAAVVPIDLVVGGVSVAMLPLSVALHKGHAPPTIGVLLAAHDEVLMMQNGDGSLPLHVALRSCATSVTITMLLGFVMERARASLFIRDEAGMIPLETAVASRNSFEVVDQVLHTTMLAMKTAFDYMMAVGCEDDMQMGIKFSDEMQRSHVDGEKCVKDISHVVHKRALVCERESMVDSAFVTWSMSDQVARKTIVMHMCEAGSGQGSDDMAILAMLLERLAKDTLVASDEHDVTLLHIAAARKCPLRVLVLIMEMLPGCVFAVDKYGNTAMHYAAQNTHARCLVDDTVCGPWHENVSGAPPCIDESFAEDECRARPALDCVRLLGEAWPGACAVVNAAGMTPFDYVVASNCTVQVAKLVLSYNMRAVQHSDHNGMTPMHRACTRASPEAILEKGGFGAGSEDFFLSSGKERFRLISWLLELYPVGARRQCVDKSMPLHFAAFNNCDATVVARVLRACPRALYVGDSGGETPFHLAARWINAPFASNSGVLQILLHEAPNFKALNNNLHSVLRSSLPVLMGGQRQREPLSPELTHFISQVQRDDNGILVAMMLADPSAIWTVDAKGQTPLSYMCNLVAECIGTDNFASVFQQNLMISVCVLGVLRSEYVPYDRAVSEMDNICYRQRKLKERIEQSDMSTSGVEMIEIDSAFLQMSEGLMAVRMALEESFKTKKQKELSKKIKGKIVAIQSEITHNINVLAARQHEQELLEMLEAESNAPVAAGGGARRKQRNKRIAEDRREKARDVSEQHDIMQTIQGQLMRQSTDNARIKALNRKKSKKASKNARGAAAAPDHDASEAGAAVAFAVEEDMYDSCGSGSTEIYEPPALDVGPLAVEPRPWSTTRRQDNQTSLCSLPLVARLPLVGHYSLAPLQLADAVVAEAVQRLVLDEPVVLAVAAEAFAAVPEEDAIAALQAAQRAACLEEAKACIMAQQHRERECAVCMDALKTNPFVPCGHVAACDACAGERE